MAAALQQFERAVEDLRRLAKAKPFAAVPVTFSGKDEAYGKPAAGTKSEARGLFAARHVHRELLMLCEMIYQEGFQFEDDSAAIDFGTLFQVYSVINNKLVGLLMRARKHGLLYFEGEMLFQRRDDDKPILLLKPITALRQELTEPVEFQLGQAMASSSK